MNFSVFDDETMGAASNTPRGLILQIEGTMPENSGYLYATELIRQRVENGNTLRVVGVTEKGTNTWHLYLNVQNTDWTADALKNTVASILSPYMNLNKVLVVSEQAPFSTTVAATQTADGTSADASSGETAQIFGMPWYVVAGGAAAVLFLLSSMDGKK